MVFSMEFFLNGEFRKYSGDVNLNLLKYLREIEGITTAKDGCSCQGACGACTVEIDGKATLACATKMKTLAGKHILTTEGLELKIQEYFARAFMEKGGVQCGFCIPGIVMAAKTLLAKNLNPTRQEVKKAIARNLCRCTGYKKIVDSILYAAKLMRGEEALSVINYSGKVGTFLPKYDAYDTVLGKREFVCDIKFPNMLHGALKYSDHPRAKIIKIDLASARAIKGVRAIYTAEDIPGDRVVGIVYRDWPMMIKAGEITHYIGDVLAGVVADSEAIAREAVALIKVEYEVLKPLCTVDAAKKKNAPKLHEKGNILSASKIKRGNPNQALKDAAFVTRGTYYTQRIEHAFIETECCVATPWKNSGKRGVKVFSQGQGAYEDRKQIGQLLKLPLDLVNVIQVQNGGGFGGKEDLSVQGHASLFAYLQDMPVRVFLTREESLRMHPKRHPMRMKYEVGCDKDGMLTVVRAYIDGDSGAYASVGMKVLERAAGHATSAYAVPNVDIEAYAVYTNNIPCGAMRGFGVNQTAFAMDSCIDDLCRQGGFDRWQFRYNNCLKEGSMTATGQVLKGGVGVARALEALKDKFYAAKFAGLACGIKNTGIGNGMADKAEAKIVIADVDHVIIYHGWTEMGQGVHTMAMQTVAQETGINPDIMEVRVDTTSETVCGMTTASRGTSLVGNSLLNACIKLKADLKHKKISELVGQEYRGSWSCDWTTDLNDVTIKEQVTHYSYSFAAQLVTLNQYGKIDKVYAAHDAGKIMNPILFEGQIQGSVHMGLGYALSEKFPMKDGWPTSFKLARCGVLRSTETPDVEVIGIESGDLHGPYGAKGVGEIGLVPTAAAVANALFQFDGVRRTSLPFGLSKNQKEK